MRNLLVLITVLFLISARFSIASELHLYLAVSSENVGDQDQIRAIAEELRNNYKFGPTKDREFEFTSEKSLMKIQIESDISKSKDKNDLFLLLTAGTHESGVVKVFRKSKN